MSEILENGAADRATTRQLNRKGEPPIRSFFAKQFYSIINRISDADIVDGARDFRLMKREMVDAIISMSEYNRFSKGIFGWIGFRTYWLPFENVERIAGETKWNFWKLFKYAIDGIINFSQVTLSIASWFGIMMTFISFVSMLFVIVRRLIFGDPVAGWASTICIVIFIGGIQLLSLGIIGQYIAKIYMEVKHRPHYIISETNRQDIEKVRWYGERMKGWMTDMTREIPILYREKKDCCGCSACYAVCPNGAIYMAEDEEGFAYPYIDKEKCVACYMCIKVCPLKE